MWLHLLTLILEVLRSCFINTFVNSITSCHWQGAHFVLNNVDVTHWHSLLLWFAANVPVWAHVHWMLWRIMIIWLSPLIVHTSYEIHGCFAAATLYSSTPLDVRLLSDSLKMLQWVIGNYLVLYCHGYPLSANAIARVIARRPVK